MKNKCYIRKFLVVIMVMILMISAGANNRLQAMSNETDPNDNYSAIYEDEDVKVKVSAKAGILPADAQLSVKPIKQQEVNDAMSEEEKSLATKLNEEYRKTSEKINEKNANLEGFLAYDISFSVNGEEIEPNGDVDVSMEFIKAMKPEGVSDNAVASVQHLKESGEDVVVETLDKEQDVVTVDEKAAVKTVSLQSDSFSIFTITWNRPSNDGHGHGINTLKVKVLDTNGKEIDLGDSNITFNLTTKEMKTADLANNLIKNANGKLDDYTFGRAYILQNGQQKTFARMARWSNAPDSTGGFQANTDSASYNYNTWDKDSDGEKYAYFVFKEKIKFSEVNTIDSTSKGIQMKMIDYYPTQDNSKKQYLGAGYNTNAGDPTGKDVPLGAKQGILSNRLGDDGYPTFEGKWNLTNQAGESLTNKSLIDFYKNAEGDLGTVSDANHLFLESVYSDKGHYYYYDSGMNAATFDTKTGNFTVYNQLVTPEVNNTKFFHKRGNFLPFNTFNNPGIANNPNLYLANGDSLPKTDPLYKAPLYTPDQKTKFTFGMELSANFVQNQDGYFDGNNMRYEFTGDDDLWVYIDGVLVLDIGGIHDAREGYIDFSTGEVYVQGKGLTSLKEQFEKAGIKDNIWKEVEYVSRDEKNTKGYIFNDFTSHKFNMWYMERGSGASNLKVKFNLPVIPENQIQIRKELGDEEDDIKYGNENYGYKLYVLENGKYEQVIDSSVYDAQLQKSDGITREALKMNEQGVFYLKPEETAIFNDVGAYYVKEVGIDTNEYNKVTINGAESKIENNVAKSKEFSATETQMVTFRNYPKEENLSDLTIEKVMKAGQSSEDSFDFNVKMENSYGKLVAYHGNYQLIDRDGTEKTLTSNGIIKLKTGQKAVIKNILTGTSFYVDETVGEDYGKPIYTATNATIASDKASVSGETNKDNDVIIKVENRLARVGNMKLLKVDQENNKLTLKGVEFTIYEGDKSLMSAMSQANGIVSFDISKLEKGHEYLIKETKGADKYLTGITVNGKAVEYLKLVINEHKNDDGTINTEGKLFTPDGVGVALKDDTFVIANLKDTRISVDVEKKWEDKDYVNRPKEVEIQLYQKVLNQEATEVKDKKLTLNADNDWKGTFKDLPYWDEKTKTPIEYSVKEVLSMEEYGSKVTKKKETQNGYEVPSFVVTNTLKTGSLIINKDIVESELNPALGDPIFTFEIRRNDDSLIYYRTIRLSELNLSGSVRIDNLPYGEYTVKELDTLRYTCMSDIIQKATINEQQKIAVVNYKNKLTKDDLFSHTDVIENQFKIQKDGSVTITKNKLEKVEAKAFLPELDGMLNSLLQVVKEVE